MLPAEVNSNHVYLNLLNFYIPYVNQLTFIGNIGGMNIW